MEHDAPSLRCRRARLVVGKLQRQRGVDGHAGPAGPLTSPNDLQSSPRVRPFAAASRCRVQPLTPSMPIRTAFYRWLIPHPRKPGRYLARWLMTEETALERYGDDAVKASEEPAEWRNVLEAGEVDLGVPCVSTPRA